MKRHHFFQPLDPTGRNHPFFLPSTPSAEIWECERCHQPVDSWLFRHGRCPNCLLALSGGVAGRVRHYVHAPTIFLSAAGRLVRKHLDQVHLVYLPVVKVVHLCLHNSVIKDEMSPTPVWAIREIVRIAKAWAVEEPGLEWLVRIGENLLGEEVSYAVVAGEPGWRDDAHNEWQ